MQGDFSALSKEQLIERLVKLDDECAMMKSDISILKNDFRSSMKESEDLLSNAMLQISKFARPKQTIGKDGECQSNEWYIVPESRKSSEEKGIHLSNSENNRGNKSQNHGKGKSVLDSGLFSDYNCSQHKTQWMVGIVAFLLLAGSSCKRIYWILAAVTILSLATLRCCKKTSKVQ